MGDTPQPHRAVNKNGRDHAQDREIRELRNELKISIDEFKRFRESEEAWKHEDRSTHDQLIRSVTRQNVLIGLAAGVFSAFVAWLGALWIKIDNVEERLMHQHQTDQLRNDAHTFKGEQWGTTMERDIEKNRAELRALENRLFGRRKQSE